MLEGCQSGLLNNSRVLAKLYVRIFSTWDAQLVRNIVRGDRSHIKWMLIAQDGASPMETKIVHHSLLVLKRGMSVIEILYDIPSLQTLRRCWMEECLKLWFFIMIVQEALTYNCVWTGKMRCRKISGSSFIHLCKVVDRVPYYFSVLMIGCNNLCNNLLKVDCIYVWIAVMSYMSNAYYASPP